MENNHKHTNYDYKFKICSFVFLCVCCVVFYTRYEIKQSYYEKLRKQMNFNNMLNRVYAGYNAHNV